HARGFNIPGRSEVVAASDISQDNLNHTCDAAGIPLRFVDHRTMLAEVRPDIVAICTWPPSHAALTVDCAGAGVRGILCEKPMAMSMADCDAMIAACAASGVRLGIGHHYRFQPAILSAREMIARGEIGEILLAQGISREGLHNSASHHVDLCRFLMGDPAPAWALAQVERLTDRFERGTPIEDCALGVIGFEDGRRLILESDLAQGAAELHLYGTRCNLRFVRDRAYRSDPAEGWQEITAAGESLQHVSFLDWLDGGDQYPSYSGNGRAVIECLNGMIESARRRRRMSFPLDVPGYPLQAMIESGELPVDRAGAYDIRAGGPRWRNER
ncbi:MAG: Gfo/Idh/MocA family oxidoreductase, partial [Chloroflexi bacterium]|nr:Gfo/Idh/MocA family oxidoreductase [Chloroflexota bacterium]